MRQILLLLVAAGIAVPALAHDSWISKGGLRNPQGEWCCGEGDCRQRRCQSPRLIAEKTHLA